MIFPDMESMLYKHFYNNKTMRKQTKVRCADRDRKPS